MKEKTRPKKEQPAAETKLSIFAMIVNMFIGLLNFYISIYAFREKFFILGVLYILLGLFSFIPKKIIKISHGKRLLFIIIASVIFLILPVIFGWYTSQPPINHNMQEEFIMNMGASNASLIIYNTTKSTSIDGETTKGYFLIVNCRVINLGSSPMIINSRFGYYLEDNQNNTFNGRFSAVGETLQPNLGEKCYFLFEIPKSSQGIKLYLKAYLEKHAVDLKI